MTRLLCAVLVLLAWPRLAAAEEPAPAAAGAGPAPAAPSVEVPASPAPAVAPARRPFSLQAGWGYYEVLHAGATWHVSERAALELFAGAGFAGGDETGSIGLAFRHAIGKPIKGMPWGWNFKALYWSQSDPDYDWKMVSLVAGAYVVRALDPRLSLKLDAGVVFTGALDSERKQDENFASPQRWNGSVCLELVYRLGVN